MLENLASVPPSLFSKDGTRLNQRAYIILVLLCLAIFIPGLATMPPTDRDESLFAQASKQMIENGDYVDIRFQDMPRYKKPVGIYWLQSAAVRLFNPHHLNEIWAYRIPSLVGATVAVVMTAALGELLFGPMAGFLAALMVAGCLILNVEARIAKTDAALLGSIMVAQYALGRAYISYGISKFGKAIPLAFWTALGIGVLIKGPIILLVVGSTLIWLRVTERNLGWFRTLKPYLGIPYLLLLVAPWFAAIMLASRGQFLEQSAGHDLLGKIWQGQGRSFIPPGGYLLAFPLTFFPFSLWAMLAIPDTWRNRTEPAVRFCLGWIIPVWIIFELAISKLPHYVMPLYPAIAMLAARGFLDAFPALTNRRLRWVQPVAIGAWLLVGIAIAVLTAFLPFKLDGAWNTGQIAASLLLLIAMGTSLKLLHEEHEGSITIMVAGSLVFTSCMFANTLPRIETLWMSRQIILKAGQINPCEGDPRLISTYNEPSLVFLAGTKTILQNDLPSIAEDLRRNPCHIAVIKQDQRETFLRQFPDAAPKAAAEIRGLILAKGRGHDITLYTMPSERK